MKRRASPELPQHLAQARRVGPSSTKSRWDRMKREPVRQGVGAEARVGPPHLGQPFAVDDVERKGRNLVASSSCHCSSIEGGADTSMKSIRRRSSSLAHDKPRPSTVLPRADVIGNEQVQRAAGATAFRNGKELIGVEADGRRGTAAWNRSRSAGGWRSSIISAFRRNAANTGGAVGAVSCRSRSRDRRRSGATPTSASRMTSAVSPWASSDTQASFHDVWLLDSIDVLHEPFRARRAGTGSWPISGRNVTLMESTQVAIAPG